MAGHYEVVTPEEVVGIRRVAVQGGAGTLQEEVQEEAHLHDVAEGESFL